MLLLLKDVIELDQSPGNYFSEQQVLVGDPKGVGSIDSDSDFEDLQRKRT